MCSATACRLQPQGEQGLVLQHFPGFGANSKICAGAVLQAQKLPPLRWQPGTALRVVLVESKPQQLCNRATHHSFISTVLVESLLMRVHSGLEGVQGLMRLGTVQHSMAGACLTSWALQHRLVRDAGVFTQSDGLAAEWGKS